MPLIKPAIALKLGRFNPKHKQDPKPKPQTSKPKLGNYGPPQPYSDPLRPPCLSLNNSRKVKEAQKKEPEAV
jgi:hypothetical protein